MKTYLLLVAVILSICSAQSCRRCYTCTSKNLTDEVCKIDGRYAYAEQGQLTDGQGDTMVCTFK